MKWGILGVFVVVFLFLAVSSLSSMGECQDDSYCVNTYGWGWTCVSNQCVPPAVSTPCPDQDLRDNISDGFGITVDDGCDLDRAQLRVIYNVLKVVPEDLHDVNKITTTSGETDPHILEISSYPSVGDGLEDKIPDGKGQYVDRFSINFVYKLNKGVRRKMITDTPLAQREDQLIYYANQPACATSDPKYFLRSDYPCYYFGQNHDEFFPRISEAYFQNSEATLNLTINRFSNGYKHPINQFLFFAGIYSLGSDTTKFYAMNRSGAITAMDVDLEGINIGGIRYITSLSFDGYRYEFSLHSNGSVKNISVIELQPSIYECDDKTPYGQCSSSNAYGKPWYCNETGQLVQNCSECGCKAGFYCQENVCISYGQPPTECTDGTPLGGCSTSAAYGKPFYCNETGALVMNCSRCGCDTGYYCDKSGGCNEKCIDGTRVGSCSTSLVYGKPFYCNELGKLAQNCSECGCEEGKLCENGKCVEKCEDGTPYGQCSNVTKSFLCEYGELVEDCMTCGCEGNLLCENGTCVQKCSDGTHWGNCSKTTGKPWYCDKGMLIEKCSVCGCYPYSFCEPVNDTCQYTQTPENHIPALNRIGDKTSREGKPLVFNVSGFDLDGDTLTFHIHGLPKGAKFGIIEESLADLNKRIFNWIPGYDQAGIYEVIFIVSDGKANVSEKIKINVTDFNRRPKAGIYYPSDNREFYVDEIIQFSGKWSVDADKDPLTYFWYFGDGDTAVGITDEHAYQEPGTYNVTLEVSDGKLSDTDFITLKIRSSDEPIQDEDRDGVDDQIDKCPDTIPLERVNIYGCPLPEYTKFRNDLTTDFSKVDLLNATNITIGIPGKARIEFRKNTMNIVRMNLDKYVDIGHMNLEIKTDKIPELNKSAVVTFYEVTIEDPVILRDGKYCYECQVISYLDGSFAFSVQHFTRYSLMAWASFSGYCGDGLCSIYETCYDCTTDCGKCKEPEAPTHCNEYWMCGGWSACNELNLQTRECNDVNFCGTERNKPKEITECKEEPFPSLTLFGIIVFVLTTIYIVTERYKKKKEMRKLGTYELHEIIKGYMYRGFTKKDIIKILKTRGYETSEINKLINEVEKEMF